MSYIDPILRANAGRKYIGTAADVADIKDPKNQLSVIKQKLFIAEIRPIFCQNL